MSVPEASLDLIVVADLVPGRDDSPQVRGLHRVEPESLGDLMARLAPSVTLPPALGSAPIPTEIRFTSLKDFRPEQLAKRTPVIADLVALRETVADWGRGRTPLETVKQALTRLPGELPLAAAAAAALAQASAPPARPETNDEQPPQTPAPDAARAGTDREGDALSSLLDMVDIDASRPGARPAKGAEGGRETRAASGASQRALEGLIRDILGAPPAAERPDAATVQALGAAIDQELAGGLRAVLHAAEFRTLEAAWLGLQFLVKRIDVRAGVRVHVVASGRSAMLDTLRERVMPFVDEVRHEARVPLVLLDASFDIRGDDVGVLSELAELAEQMRAPILADVDPDALGLASLRALKGQPDLEERLAGPGYEAWQALRGRDAARWLVLGVNRFLLRPPYGQESLRVKGLAFEEQEPGGDKVGVLGRTTWLQGVLTAASFVRTGWGVDCTGAGESGSVGDLPVRSLELETGEVIQAPLEALLPENRVLQLSQAGLAAAACRRNGDEAFLVTSPTVYRPRREEEDRPGRSMAEEGRRASLPYQLFVTQVAVLLESVWRNLDPASRPAEMARTLASGLEFLTSRREGAILSVEAETVEDPTLAAGAQIELRITPTGWPLRGLPAMALALPVPVR